MVAGATGAERQRGRSVSAHNAHCKPGVGRSLTSSAEQYAAFDRLPQPVRAVLRVAPTEFCAVSVLKSWLANASRLKAEQFAALMHQGMWRQFGVAPLDRPQ